MIKTTSAKRKGIITALLLILLSFCSSTFLPVTLQPYSRYLIFLLFIVGLLWTLNSFRQQQPNSLFRDYFNEGFRHFIVVTFFMAVYTFVFYKFNPLPAEYEQYIQHNAELLKQQGNRTIDEINENTMQWKKHFMPLVLSLTNFTYLILGGIVSAVAGYVYSRKK